MCNSGVDFIMRKDRRNRIRVTPLQGKTAEHLNLPEDGKLDSLVFEKDGKVYFRSNAVIRCMSTIGGGWKLMWALVIFPRFFRDWIYDWIARNRYKWFGKHETCRIPTPEEVAKFLP